MLDWTARGRDAMRPALDALVAATDLADGLVDLARTIQADGLDDQVVRMRRLVAAEADRLPDVAARYVGQSWTRNIAALGEAFAGLIRRGALAIDEPILAAEQFTWLVVGGPLNRRTLGAGRPPTAELDATARAATATFLSRYGR